VPTHLHGLRTSGELSLGTEGGAPESTIRTLAFPLGKQKCGFVFVDLLFGTFFPVPLD
jgi:hypothetical protein